MVKVPAGNLMKPPRSPVTTGRRQEKSTVVSGSWETAITAGADAVGPGEGDWRTEDATATGGEVDCEQAANKKPITSANRFITKLNAELGD
jgi:hypothetical protein